MRREPHRITASIDDPKRGKRPAARIPDGTGRTGPQLSRLWPDDRTVTAALSGAQ